MMPSLMQYAALLFGVAVLVGLLLAVRILRGAGAVLPLPLGLLHGSAGTAGLVLLILGLLGGPTSRGVATGSAGFGPAAAVGFVAALSLGVLLLGLRLARRRPAGLAVAIHAGLAITAFVLLLGYLALG